MYSQSFVYILTNKNNNVFYIGLTANLIKRGYQHKTHIVESFTEKYKTSKLVYYELFEDIESAIRREKQLKNWHRDWKVNLIIQHNPDFKDLYSEILK